MLKPLTSRRVVVLLVVAVAILAIGAVTFRLLTIDPVSKQAAALLGTWRPTSITGFPNLASAPTDRATIIFTADGDWRGSDGCNAIGGKFKATATKISTYDLGPQTAIGCNNVPNVTVLEEAVRWQATSTTLTLYGESSTPLATYTR
jgi:heat shock protein HslJ